MVYKKVFVFQSPALLTPPLTEVRVTRSSRLSARKLFPSLVAEKPEPQSPRTPKSSKPRKVNGTPKVVSYCIELFNYLSLYSC